MTVALKGMNVVLAGKLQDLHCKIPTLNDCTKLQNIMGNPCRSHLGDRIGHALLL